jgi:hypothetical protein
MSTIPFFDRLPALFRGIFKKKIKEINHQPDLEALYAFRTIITMLSLIRSAKAISNKQGRHGFKELKIVDALAAIIIREHGVAAVAAEAPDGSGTIQVFTSVSFFVAQNPCRTDKKNLEASSKSPSLIDPTQSIPKHLKGNNKSNEQLLDAFLTHDW